MNVQATLEYHEAANIFPLDEEHIDELAEDIRQRRLQVPIETLDGKIIDGRRRYLACQKAGVQPRFREVETDDPIAYVLSLNLYRRHLKTSQASACAARAEVLKEKLRDEAKARMSQGGQKAGKHRPLQGGDNCPHPEDQGRTRDQLGAMFGVSGKSVERAAKVLRDGVPELVQAVDRGEISINKAQYISCQTESMQRELLDAESQREQVEQRRAKPQKDSVAEKTVSEGEIKGVGVIRAHEAINCLTRIPKNDALRKRGFQIVTDWIRHNR